MLRNAGKDIKEFIFQRDTPSKERWLQELVRAGKVGFAWWQNSFLDKEWNADFAQFYDMDLRY